MAEKIVILSTNANPDYYFFAPYQKKAWNKFGWKVAVMVTHDCPDVEADYLIRLPEFEGVRDATVAQASRLYAANHLPEEALLMTCDMDLIPLSDYWHPDPNNITVYGHDLTWHSFYPMGYCAMTGAKWKEKFHLTGNTEADFIRDAKRYSEMVYSDQFEKYWDYDWTLLTDTLKPFAKELTFINRGQIDIAGATLAKGRIDRYNISATAGQPEPFIDYHGHNTSMNNPERLKEFTDIYERFHGSL